MIRLFSFSRILAALLVLAAVACVVPAQAAVSGDKLEAAIAKLEKAGVITDGAYWRENARRNHTCDGEKVAALIIAGAKRQGGKVNDLDGALNHLRKRGVLTKTDYWTTNAIAGRECSGGQVGSLISRLAGSTKVK